MYRSYSVTSDFDNSCVMKRHNNNLFGSIITASVMELVENLCRLCFEQGNIQIFDDNGRSLEIATIIKQHLDCEVDEDDSFPKCVCSVCWNHIRSFHTFYEFVKNAQTKYLLTTIKTEHQEKCEEVLKSNSAVEQPLGEQNKGENALIEEEEDGEPLLMPFKVVTENAVDVFQEYSTPIVKRKKGRPRKEATNGEMVHSSTFNKGETVASWQPHDRSTTGPFLFKSEGTFGEKNLSDNGSERDVSEVTKKRGRPKKRPNECELDEVLDGDEVIKQKTRDFGDIAKERSTYSLSKDYEEFMLENFGMSCDHCSATDFKSFFDVKTHYMAQHKTIGFVRCCNQKFIYIGQVKDHIDYHLNPEVHRCKICNRRSKSKAMLQRHMKEHEDVFTCDICGFKCGRKPGIMIHIFRKHVPAKPDIKCEECHKAFSDVILLDRHIRVVHTKQIRPKRTTCEICGKSVNAYLMSRHNLVHMSSEERQKTRYQCDVCNEWFYSYSGMYQHRLNHSDPIKCEHCNKEFVSKSALTQHVRRMHGNLEHKCPLCERAYHIPHLLKIHIESHTRDKQYPCLFCPKIFQVQKSRRTHYSRHHRAEFDETKRQRKIQRYGEP